MSNAIAVQVTFQEMERLAEAIAASGLFGMKHPSQALSLMAIAQAEGVHPALAARDFHIIQGRPTLKADAMLSRFQSAGGRMKMIEYTDARVVAEFSHPQGGTVVVDWDLERAKRAGLAGKDSWRNYPRQMLRARVISEGVRTVFPGATAGMYAPEEAADIPEPIERDVTPPKATTGVAALQERITALAPAPKAEAQPQVVVDTGTGEVLPAADAMTFAEVADALNRASDRDSIILARDLIRGVADEQQRAELDVLARERANAIRAARKREAAEAEVRG